MERVYYSTSEFQNMKARKVVLPLKIQELDFGGHIHQPFLSSQVKKGTTERVNSKIHSCSRKHGFHE